MTAGYQSRFGNTIDALLAPAFGRSGQGGAAVRRVLPDARLLQIDHRAVPVRRLQDGGGGDALPRHGHQTISNAYGNEYRIDDRGYDWLLQHEFAHEWFANQLTNANADHMWLKGLGTYMQPLYARYLHGGSSCKAELKGQRMGLANAFPVVSRTDRSVNAVYGGSEGPGGDIYNKGSLISATLRMTLGDEDFYEAIHVVWCTAAPITPGQFRRVATTQDFNAIVNSVTGEDYDWFFDVYLYNAALPKLTRRAPATSDPGLGDERPALPHAGRSRSERRGADRDPDGRPGDPHRPCRHLPS